MYHSTQGLCIHPYIPLDEYVLPMFPDFPSEKSAVIVP